MCLYSTIVEIIVNISLLLTGRQINWTHIFGGLTLVCDLNFSPLTPGYKSIIYLRGRFSALSGKGISHWVSSVNSHEASSVTPESESLCFLFRVWSILLKAHIPPTLFRNQEGCTSTLAKWMVLLSLFCSLWASLSPAAVLNGPVRTPFLTLATPMSWRTFRICEFWLIFALPYLLLVVGRERGRSSSR